MKNIIEYGLPKLAELKTLQELVYSTHKEQKLTREERKQARERMAELKEELKTWIDCF